MLVSSRLLLYNVSEDYESKIRNNLDLKITSTYSIEKVIPHLDPNLETILILPDSKIAQLADLKNKLSSDQLYPRTILLVSDISKDKLIDLINEGMVHRIMNLDRDEDNLIDLIENLMVELKNKTKSDTNTSASSAITLGDHLVDLILNLSEKQELDDFANQFVAVLEGIKSFIQININLYFDDRDSYYLNNVFSQISDLQLLGDQFDQKVIRIYCNILQAMIKLELGDTEEAMPFYKEAVRTFYWISSEYLDQNLVNAINDFPIHEDDWYYIQKGKKELSLSEEDKQQLRENTRQLINAEIAEFINVSDAVASYQGESILPLQYLIVIKGSIPVYVHDVQNVGIQKGLVSGFVSALSDFLGEMVKSKGDIRKISHDNGVLILYTMKDFRYVALASQDDIFMRVGLRQFANLTIEYFDSMEDNVVISEDNKEIAEIFNEVFE